MKTTRTILLWVAIITAIIALWPTIANVMRENLLIREDQGDSREKLTKYTYPYTHVARLRSEISVCTATLIAPKILITAAHCVINGKNKQYFSAKELRVDFFQGSSEHLVQTRSVAKIWSTDDFKDYGFQKMQEDWAFVTLHEPMIIKNTGNIDAQFPIVAKKINTYPLPVWQAGFGPGAHDYLYIDENCRIIRKENHILRTNCLVVPGDSGGPIFWQHDDGTFIWWGLIVL